MKSIWTYEQYLPVVPEGARVMLGEGHTPLVKSKAIGEMLGVKNLYFKLETVNPTGSYKDRFAAVLVSEMVAKGQKVCIATSSGNTGAALSAYCAAAGIQCIIVVVDGAPLAKVKQMQLYGAKIVMVKGFGKDSEITDRIFKELEKITTEHGLPLPISAYRYCPTAMRGVETIGLEILEELEEAHIFSPAGGGGLTLATIRGVMNSGGDSSKVSCVQPLGNDTIASAIKEGRQQANAVNFSTTKVSGLQVANVLDGDYVVKGVNQLNGSAYVVSDEDVFHWQKVLARREGIFCEPAGAVALAGLHQAIREKRVDLNETFACLVTGSGFKDMASVDNNFELVAVSPESEEVAINSIINLF